MITGLDGGNKQQQKTAKQGERVRPAFESMAEREREREKERERWFKFSPFFERILATLVLPVPRKPLSIAQCNYLYTGLVSQRAGGQDTIYLRG